MSFEELIKKGDFLPYEQSDEYTEYLWTDFDKCNELIEKEKDLFIYTVVHEGTSMWVTEGFWRINRVGYLFSRKHVSIEGDIEY